MFVCLCVLLENPIQMFMREREREREREGGSWGEEGHEATPQCWLYSSAVYEHTAFKSTDSTTAVDDPQMMSHKELDRLSIRHLACE